MRNKNRGRPDQGFFIAAFNVDGSLEGLGHWGFDRLSDRWLRICERHLETHGLSHDVSWKGALSHIKTQFVSESGAALMTFLANDEPAASFALFSRLPSGPRHSVEAMFVNHLRKINVVAMASRSPEPFKEILAIQERPLMVAVPWGNAEVSERDDDLVRELAVHMAGAFFMGASREI